MKSIKRVLLNDKCLGGIAFLILCMLIISELFIPINSIRKMAKSDALPLITGQYKIEFPYEEDAVVFGDGWHEQGGDEAYRWSRKKSFFYAKLSDQQMIRLTGYLPVGFNVSRVDVYLNNKLIAGTDLSQEQQFVLEASIRDEIKKNKKNTFKIVFDNERVPNGPDDDQRTFSALFSMIELQ